jgi:AcrR family transcriptional regulator
MIERANVQDWRVDDRFVESRRNPEATRVLIERAALELFVTKGIAETSIRDIAAAAGVSLGAIYNHFPGKDELANEMFVAAWVDIARGLRERARDHDGFPAKLKSMIGYVYRRFDEDWLKVTYVFMTRHIHLKDLPPGRENPYMVFQLVIAEAMRKGEARRMDPQLATSLIIGGIIQVIDSRILGRVKSALERHAEATASAFLRMTAP